MSLPAPELLTKFIPPEIKEICKGLLDKDQEKRMGFEQIIEYKIIQDEIYKLLHDFYTYPGFT